MHESMFQGGVYLLKSEPGTFCPRPGNKEAQEAPGTGEVSPEGCSDGYMVFLEFIYSSAGFTA